MAETIGDRLAAGDKVVDYGNIRAIPGISASPVEKHFKRSFGKFDVRARSQAVAIDVPSSELRGYVPPASG